MHPHYNVWFVLGWLSWAVVTIAVSRRNEIRKFVRESLESACGEARVPVTKAIDIDHAYLHRVLNSEDGRGLTLEEAATAPAEVLEKFLPRFARCLGINLYTQDDLYRFAGVSRKKESA